MYYDDGSLEKSTDRLGRSITYFYDALNRLEQETWTAAGGATVDVLTYKYDLNGQLFAAYDSAGNYSYDYLYDDVGHLRWSQANGLVNAGVNVILSEEYDDDNRRKVLAANVHNTPDFINTYEYDDGNVGSVTRYSGDYLEKRMPWRLIAVDAVAGGRLAERSVSVGYSGRGICGLGYRVGMGSSPP